jgi:(p)ppGpp synthase/HD superfamily hydrolase
MTASKSLVCRAELFAERVHEDQCYGDTIYYKHLLDTWSCYVFAAKKHDLPYDECVAAACWLHDTLEDTTTKYSELVAEFGEEVADIVYAVTDEKGRNRAERHRKTYLGIVLAGDNAVAVKLCDRIANLAYSVATKNKSKLRMYVGEDMAFRDLLTTPSAGQMVAALWDGYLEVIDSSKRLLEEL